MSHAPELSADDLHTLRKQTVARAERLQEKVAGEIAELSASSAVTGTAEGLATLHLLQERIEAVGKLADRASIEGSER